MLLMSFHSFQYFRQIEMKSVVCIRIQNILLERFRLLEHILDPHTSYIFFILGQRQDYIILGISSQCYVVLSFELIDLTPSL